MKIAIITDQHFGVRGDDQDIMDRQERFYAEIFFPTIKEHGVERVYDAGDTFDKRKNVNFHTLERACQMYFNPLSSLGIPLVSVVGNHTAYYRNTNTINTMERLFKNDPLVTVVRDSIYIDEFGIGLVPWISSDNEATLMAEIQNTDAHTLFGHFEFKGFKMHGNTYSEHGLSSSMFKRFDNVYSGHFHEPSEQGNITYLGAPYEMRWDDFGGRRGFHILDTDSMELTFIKNTFVSYHVIDMSEEDIDVADISSLDLSEFKGAHVKIIGDGKQKDDNLKRELEKIASSVKMEFKSTKTEKTEITAKGETTLGLISAYVVDSVGEGDFGKRLKAEMLDVYTTVNSR